MALGNDGSIRIRAGLDHSDFDRGITSMTRKVNTFGTTLKKLAGLVSIAFGTAALVNFTKEAVNAESSLNDAWMGLESIVEGQGKSFSKAKRFINDYISDGLVPLENAVTSYKNLAARGYSTEQIEKTVTALKDAAAFGRQANYSLGEAVATATEGLKNENSILVDNAGVTKNVAKMWEDYAKSIGKTTQTLTQEEKIQAEVNGILEETRFQTGDAAKLVNTYSGEIALLGYNFQNLKVQVGNAIMPIVQAVLPGINTIIAALTKLATVFSQVTALLFGRSAQVKATNEIASSAGAAADATDKLADATSDAGAAGKQAAKDLKGVLASFDELNILASQAESGGGGSGGGDLVPEIEIPSFEAEIEETDLLSESFSSLGEIFIKVLDDMLAAMPGFRKALLDFADSFNEFNKKLYDAFKFPGVVERVELLGRELAYAFNDLVNAIDWELWGRTLGAGLNLALQFLTEFIYNFDWVNLGKKLAAFINGLVYEVDWYDFGRLLWSQFKIALETFAGFITGLDMPVLAKAASDIIMGFFDEMKNTIARIDWNEIGKQIAEFLNNIDWIGVITSIAGALKEAVFAALELVAGFIMNADPDTLLIAALFFGSKLLGKLISTVIAPIAKQIADNIIKQIADAITGGGLGSLISSIGAKIAELAKPLAGIGLVIAGLVTSVTSFFSMWNDGFSVAKEAVMLVGIALTAVGAVLLGVPATIAAIVAGIVAAVATGVILIKEHWEEIKEAAVNACEKVKEAWNAAGEWLGDLFENIKTAAAEAWQAVQDAWSAASSWFSENVIEPVREFFTGLWEDLKQWAKDTWEDNKETWGKAPTWFTDNVITPLGEFFSNMWEDVKEKGSSAWGNIKEIWGEAKSWFENYVTKPLSDAFGAAVSKIKETINGLIGHVEGMINSLIKGVNWLITQLNKIKFNVPDWVPGIGGKSFGINIPKVSEAKLPRLANGAVIPPNQQFAAILGDQRSGTNIEAPLSTIKQAVTEAIQSMGGVGGDINITVESVLDGKVVARNTVRHINDMTRASGKPVLLI